MDNLFHIARASSGPGPHHRGCRIARDTPHSVVGLHWSSDQPNAETSAWQYARLARDKTSMPPTGFEHAIPGGERPQTHALDRAGTMIGDDDDDDDNIIIIIIIIITAIFSVRRKWNCDKWRIKHGEIRRTVLRLIVRSVGLSEDGFAISVSVYRSSCTWTIGVFWWQLFESLLYDAFLLLFSVDSRLFFWRVLMW